MRRFLLSYFGLLLCLFYGGLCGAQNSIYFEHVTTEDGLSQSDVNSIYQDTNGFMWFATHEGLNRYDGYNFEVFTPDTSKPTSINSNLIWSLTGDDNGNLWIGTTGAGLNHFNAELETFTHFVHNEKDLNSLVSNQIIALHKDDSNRLWVGTINGLDMVDLNASLDEIKFQHYSFNSDTSRNYKQEIIYAVFEDSKHQIWAGGMQGLYKLTQNEIGKFHFKLMNSEIDLPQISVRSINEDSFGRLLIGTNGGFYMLDQERSLGNVVSIHNGFVNNILIENYNIWAGTDNGLLRFDNTKRGALPKFINQYAYNPRDPNSLSKNIVKSLFRDSAGVIWVGTNGGGINKFDLERKRFNHIKKTSNPNSLSYDKIRSIFEDSNGSLWIGTEGGGLNMLLDSKDTDYNGFTNYMTIPKPFVTIEIERNRRKILLIGSEDVPGLYEIDITNPKNIKETDIKRFAMVSGSIFSLIEDKDKNIWIGTYNAGINRWLYNAETKTYDKDVLRYHELDTLSISSNIIRNIIEDKNGDIWFATSEGLSKLTKEEKHKQRPRFEVYKNRPSDESSISM